MHYMGFYPFLVAFGCIVRGRSWVSHYASKVTCASRGAKAYSAKRQGDVFGTCSRSVSIEF